MLQHYSKKRLCHYCQDEPVNTFEEWEYSCSYCVFDCPDCGKRTPYEAGGSCCDACDYCHTNYKQGEHYGTDN